MASAPESPNISTWPSGGALATGVGRHYAARARHVLDDERLCRSAAVNLSRKQAGHHVGIAARSCGRDQSHGPVSATYRPARPPCDAKASAGPIIRAVDVFTADAPFPKLGHLDAPTLESDRAHRESGRQILTAASRGRGSAPLCSGGITGAAAGLCHARRPHTFCLGLRIVPGNHPIGHRNLSRRARVNSFRSGGRWRLFCGYERIVVVVADHCPMCGPPGRAERWLGIICASGVRSLDTARHSEPSMLTILPRS